MSRPSLREDILSAGLKVMFRSGYQGASVRDICAAAGAPQGSFTNHFRTKDSFVVEVLNRYFENIRRLMDETLRDKTLPPRERLKKYLDIITWRLEKDRFERGCLIGDLSVEASSNNEVLRERLSAIFAEWLVPFKECIAQGQQQGEIPDQFAADELAEFLLASWQGAMVRMKVERNCAPLERFKTIALNTVFRAKGEKFLNNEKKDKRE